MPEVRARPPFSAQVRVQRICITRITPTGIVTDDGNGTVTEHELDVIEECTARRALCVAADYMITRDR